MRLAWFAHWAYEDAVQLAHTHTGLVACARAVLLQQQFALRMAPSWVSLVTDTRNSDAVVILFDQKSMIIVRSINLSLCIVRII